MKVSSFAITLFAAVCATTAPIYATTWTTASESTIIAAVNKLRSQARTCPGGKSFAAAPPLVINPKLTSAALALGVSPSDVMQGIGRAGYLAFGATLIWNGEPNTSDSAAPDVNDFTFSDGSVLPSSPKFWLSKQRSCEALMNPLYTEAGSAVSALPNTIPFLIVVMAAPYYPANIASYKSRMFAELNRIRATGIDGAKYPGAQCSSGPVAALKWNDQLANASQSHSDDYANHGVVHGADGSPHTGTAGDSPSSRITAAGCTPFGENGNFNENVIFNYGLTPEDAVRGWITMDLNHCAFLVSTQTKVAGFGIAGSAALQNWPTEPFVTYDASVDTGCSAATKAAPDPGAALQLACGSEAGIKSIGGGTNVNVAFANKTSGVVSLYWINGTGQRSLGAVIQPGTTYGATAQRNTYVNHYFAAADSSGKCRGLYQITGSGTLSIQ
jgi:uncharacterized protein YkwD